MERQSKKLKLSSPNAVELLASLLTPTRIELTSKELERLDHFAELFYVEHARGLASGLK